MVTSVLSARSGQVKISTLTNLPPELQFLSISLHTSLLHSEPRQRCAKLAPQEATAASIRALVAVCSHTESALAPKTWFNQ